MSHVKIIYVNAYQSFVFGESRRRAFMNRQNVKEYVHDAIGKASLVLRRARGLFSREKGAPQLALPLLYCTAVVASRKRELAHVATALELSSQSSRTAANAFSHSY